MQQQKPTRLRAFLQKPVGKALLLAFAIAFVFAATAYVSVLLGIPAILLTGLAVPIWAGLKAPRYLALSGLVVLLLVAPLANVVLVQELMTPIAPVDSGNSLPTGNGGSVLQNASVSPYVGGTATNYTWTVTVVPKYIPNYPTNTTESVTLFVSNCPGATTNDSLNCATPYPFWAFAQSAVNLSTSTLFTFHYQIGSLGVWDWQIGLNVTNHGTNLSYQILLSGDPTYNGIEGPVVGTFADIYGSFLGPVYVEVLLYLGASFYFVLLIYMIFKRRERNRQETAKRAAGPTPTDGSAPASASGPGASAAPRAAAVASAQEGTCPSCGAVVYAGEKTCWKCGATLGAVASSAPLPSSTPKG
ncbi:MAG TPA: hypothetical protein VMF04_06495 [Thermoplasmata archaeon]|nr:hypothetical protein [Thermoplasmata archaeon]